MKTTTLQNTQALFGSKIRKVLFLSLISISISHVEAQDQVLLKNGTAMNTKVVEINATEIKCKDPNFKEGPLRVIPTSNIMSITYENGTKEFFQVSAASDEHPATGTNSPDDTDFAKIKPKSFGGPRVGVTFVTQGSISDRLEYAGKRPILSQFGWQFEQRLFTLKNGLSGVFEFVPLIGGVEQNLFQLSASALVGLRGIGKKRLFEIAIGPNVSKTGAGIVIAAGANFNKENVNFPITLAYVPTVGTKNMQTGKTSYTGHRISLLVGFNYRKK